MIYRAYTIRMSSGGKSSRSQRSDAEYVSEESLSYSPTDEQDGQSSYASLLQYSLCEEFCLSPLVLDFIWILCRGFNFKPVALENAQDIARKPCDSLPSAAVYANMECASWQ